jgi:hypothetical protein
MSSILISDPNKYDFFFSVILPIMDQDQANIEYVIFNGMLVKCHVVNGGTLLDKNGKEHDIRKDMDGPSTKLEFIPNDYEELVCDGKVLQRRGYDDSGDYHLEMHSHGETGPIVTEYINGARTKVMYGTCRVEVYENGFLRFERILKNGVLVREKQYFQNGTYETSVYHGNSVSIYDESGNLILEETI